MKFKVGDKAVHPSHGVGEVTAVEKKDIAGSSKEFYILRVLDKGREQKVMVATDAAKRLGLRKVISRNEAKKVLGVLKEDGMAVKMQPWNRRQRAYNNMLNSGSPYEVAKVLRDLYRVRESKELSFGERRLMEQAQHLLVTELAAARRVAETKVADEIDTIFAA